MLLPSKSTTAALKYPELGSLVFGSPWILPPAFKAEMKKEFTASIEVAGKATWAAPAGVLVHRVNDRDLKRNERSYPGFSCVSQKSAGSSGFEPKPIYSS
jgi:hypothetical protein